MRGTWREDSDVEDSKRHVMESSGKRVFLL
jgi:hypothetical protein